MLLISLLGPGSSGPATSHPWVGHPVPGAQLQPLFNAEEAIDTGSFAGKVTLVNFWGPWCGPCLMEFPELLGIEQRYADDPDFQLVSIAADGQWMAGKPGLFEEDTEQLKHDSQLVLAQYNSAMPVYVDLNADFRRELVKLNPQFGYPTNFLVGRDGTIKAVWVGYGGDLAPIAKAIRAELEPGQE
ncbi:Thiol:disulfide interchange protein CycY precursor [Bremerella volcania]|uniref:Thiol:disulfide interchange protein CycY n=2 Tax=Bremerella volcania TaxID=2527984 RepID=A0A518C6B6_9BACT|nr:Thiol:disulfide interchange protein CycY precursor [Bremerella volcania]